MKMKDYSEILESAQLINNLLQKEKNKAKTDEAEVTTAPPAFDFAQIFSADDVSAILPATREFKEKVSDLQEQRLEKVLETMCKQAGFHGAVVATGDGFSIAEYKTPLESDAIAAFTPTLGQILDKTGSLFSKSGPDTMCIDIDKNDTLFLRRFAIKDFYFFLLIISPRKNVEAADLDLSIDMIISFLL